MLAFGGPAIGVFGSITEAKSQLSFFGFGHHGIAETPPQSRSCNSRFFVLEYVLVWMVDGGGYGGVCRVVK